MPEFIGEADLSFIPPPQQRKWWELFLSRRPRAIVRTELVFIDSRGDRWPVYPGTLVDGLSTPWWLWWIVRPFSWRSVRAMVIHDAYCKNRRRPSERVHEVFEEGLLCDGVHPIRARAGWLGVHYRGPKFEARTG